MKRKIKKALEIIKRREALANEGKGEMTYSEYMDIKRLLLDLLDLLKDRPA